MIDLKEKYGRSFRVNRDECGDYLIPHKFGPAMRLVPRHRPDLLGHFYAYSDTEIACFITGRTKRIHNNRLRSLLAKVSGIRIAQSGDTESTLVFSKDLFPQVARVAKAVRRRRLSPEHKEKVLASLARVKNTTPKGAVSGVIFNERASGGIPALPKTELRVQGRF